MTKPAPSWQASLTFARSVIVLITALILTYSLLEWLLSLTFEVTFAKQRSISLSQMFHLPIQRYCAGPPGLSTGGQRIAHGCLPDEDA